MPAITPPLPAHLLAVSMSTPMPPYFQVALATCSLKLGPDVQRQPVGGTGGARHESVFPTQPSLPVSLKGRHSHGTDWVKDSSGFFPHSSTLNHPINPIPDPREWMGKLRNKINTSCPSLGDQEKTPAPWSRPQYCMAAVEL